MSNFWGVRCPRSLSDLRSDDGCREACAADCWPGVTGFNQGYMTYNWTAGPVGDGGNGIAYTFHLLLANSADGSCEGCNLNSPAFRVSENGLVYQPESDTTSASAGTTSTAAARPSDQSATAASVTSTASAAGNNDAARKAGIGIGVGAGLGGALGLSAIGAGLYVLRKRRNSRQMLVSDNVVLEVDGERQGKEKLGGALAELETQPAELRADAPPWELQAR